MSNLSDTDLKCISFILEYFSYLQGGLAGLASHFPPEYMGSLGQGQIGAGIITSILDIINVASIHNNKKSSPADSAFYCFLAAALFLCLVIVALLLMTKTRYYEVS